MSMWYRTAKKIIQREAGYSTELGYLRDKLKGGIDPFDYSHYVEEYLQENEADSEYLAGDTEEWLYDADDAQRAAFTQWLEGVKQIQFEPQHHDTPIYNTMDWRGFARPEWNVHFTNHADSIGQNGFQYGHPEVDGLHYTRGHSGKNGFNFAFPADSEDAQISAGDGKYGDEAVLFYGGGADTYHHGDEEKQRLFWGKNVDPRMIFPIKHDSSGKWYVEDATGRTLVEGKNYGDVVQWVKKNYRMLQSIREKQRQRI
jgi:hypothetical protein